MRFLKVDRTKPVDGGLLKNHNGGNVRLVTSDDGARDP